MNVALSDFTDGGLRQELDAIREQMRHMTEAEHFNPIEKRLKELSRKHPRNPLVFQCLGEFYSRGLRFGEAIQALTVGTQCRDNDPLLYWDLAVACHQAHRMREAIENLQAALGKPGLDERRRIAAQAMLQQWMASAKRKN
jgi:predicted Zn-dependent protease